MRRSFYFKQVLMLYVLIGSTTTWSQTVGSSLPAEDFANLCSIGIEGTFQGSIGKTPALFNVICLDSTRMAMGINYGAPDSAVSLTLINSLIDDDGTLVFSISPLDQADRRSATSGSPTMYVRLKMDALKKGELVGVFLGGNSVRPQSLSAKKKTNLPPIPSLKSIGVSPRTVCGTYQFQMPNGPKLLLWFDMVGGVPVVTIYDGNKGLHLIDGPAWDGTGGFAITDDFGDFMPSSENLVQVRGYVGKTGEMEIYYVDPTHGVQGPLAAVHQNNSPLVFVNDLE